MLLASFPEAEFFNALVSQGSLDEAAAERLKFSLAENAGNDLYLALGKRIDEEKIAQALAQAFGLPYVNLKGVHIESQLLNVIPESTAHEHRLVAYEQTDAELKLALVDPTDRQIVDFVRKKVAGQISIGVASPSSLRLALAQYRQSLKDEVALALKEAGQAFTQHPDDLNRAAENLPIVRTMDLILKHAIFEGASDIHVEPLEQKISVRYRVDGILREVLELPRTYLDGMVARVKILSQLKIDEHRLPQDGRFKLEAEDYNIAFRVSVLPVYDGEKIVMRLLDESGRGFDMESLGMRPENMITFRRNIQKPHGMVLITGPTGSGKTTTLYAAMKELNTSDVNISTIEDPIEYRLQRINQTQVHPQIGLTFANGLRALVRQDPDILMVGEIRDEETAALAVNAALTGHLVLSTLHTNSAAGALPRLLDMKVEAFLIASTINLLVAQRLVRKLCPECRQAQPLTPDLLAAIQPFLSVERLAELLRKEGLLPAGGDLTQVNIYEPSASGCSVCMNGYKGRLGIYEMIEFTSAISSIIKPTTTSDELQQAAQKEHGIIMMIEDGIVKVIQGLTSLDEVLRMTKE